jgi:SAM-dependent methyltransferase
MRAEAARSYDAVPYGDRVYPRTHPDLLATVATLFGMAPAAPEECRVLELGCAGGANLIAMAQALPGSRFVGIDLSARQVEWGRRRVQEKGLSNVELRRVSILDVGEDWGEFDYIVCHGVYSWVPEAVRDKILAICRANLAPRGVAYVSHNCYPGWHAWSTVRDMMAFHAQRSLEPAERVRLAREVLDFAKSSVAEPGGVFARILHEESSLLERVPDDYLYHEHLDEVNHPVYFREFVEHAERHGLQYLWEAHVGELGTSVRPEVRRAIRELSSDLIVQQQYLDFLIHNRFRCSLLCHEEIELDRAIPPERMTGFRFVGRARATSPRPEIGTTTIEVFRTPGGAGMATNNPVYKAALACVADASPRALTFDEVCAATRLRLSGVVMDEPVSDEHVPWFVADLLRQAAMLKMVWLRVAPPAGVENLNRMAGEVSNCE